MIELISHDESDAVLRSVISRLEDSPTWEKSDLSSVLHEEASALQLKSKPFMTILRHALSGMKSGPSVTEIMYVLGQERSITRLSSLVGKKPQ